MKNKNCLIYNYAQHYRKNIFQEIDQNLECDLFFGDKMDDVKKLDYSLLNNFGGELKNIYFFNTPIYWQKGVLSLLIKPYKNYIILGDYYCVTTWLIAFLGTLSNKKIIFWTHGWYGNESFLKRIIKKVFFSLAHKILLYGNHAKNLMIKEGFNLSKLDVIYNSLDYNVQLESRKKLHLTNVYKEYFNTNHKVLAFIGRLTSVKKLDLILEALSKLKQENKYYNLIFIGDGKEKENLRKLAKDLSLEKNVWFYGACYEEEVLSNLIFNADLCVSPGNVGLTAMHSMTYGTSVITHNNFAHQMPEFEAIIEGKTGTFFIENDSIDLADKIDNWFRQNNDKLLNNKCCFEIIDQCYNPKKQLITLKKAIN